MDATDVGPAKGFRSEHDLKEIKVKLPIRQHIKLHSLKLLRRESISDTVLKALTEYFDRMEAAYGEPVDAQVPLEELLAAGDVAAEAEGPTADAAEDTAETDA